MTTRMPNIILYHSIKVSSIDWDYFIDCLSSTTFSRLYQSGPFYAAIRTDSLQLTDQYWDLLDSIERVVDYINDHDGFTVVGCWLV